MATCRADIAELPPRSHFGRSTGNQAGNGGIYPWADWSDGRVWVLDESDFRGRTVDQFRAAAAVHAWRNRYTLPPSQGGKLRVKVSSRWDSKHRQLWIQFYGAPDDNE